MIERAARTQVKKVFGNVPKTCVSSKVLIFVLLSAKLQIITISLSATPINRRCGFLFGKVSPTSRPSFIGCPLKRENGRHEMGANVYFKPLRDSEYGKVY